MRNLLFNIFSSFIILFSVNSLAEVSDADIEVYAELTHLNELLSGTDQQIEAELNRQMISGTTPEVVEITRRILLDSWDEAEALSILKKHIKSNLTKSDLSKLIEFHDQPWVRNIALVEKQASAPSFQSDMAIFLEGFSTHPPEPERVKIVQDFVTKTQMVEIYSEVVGNVVVAMDVAFATAKGEESFFDNQQLDTIKTQLVAQLQQSLNMISFYIYRDISNQDLTNYGDFYSSDLGLYEINLWGNAVTEVFSAWASSMSKEAQNIL